MSTEANEAARKYDTEDGCYRMACAAIPGHVNKDPDRLARRMAYMDALADHAAPLEAEVAKLRSLVQMLVDALKNMDRRYRGQVDCYGKCDIDVFINNLHTIAAAKEQGFTPTAE